MPINDPATISQTSLTMVAPLLAALAADPLLTPRRIAGLPMPAFHIASARTIVVATPVTDATLFRAAMMAATNETGTDVVLIRHGFHPEMLDDVEYDVATPARGDVIDPRPRCLYRHRQGEAWLVPVDPARTGPGAYLRLTPAGLVAAIAPPWVDADERTDGVLRAARQTLLDLRDTRSGTRRPARGGGAG